MTNDEINKYIHTEIMGKSTKHRSTVYGTQCVQCGASRTTIDITKECRAAVIPDYCSDGSPRWLLNEPFTLLRQEMGEGAFGQLLIQSDTFNSFTANGVGLGIWMTADAETLARFCVEAHKALKEL